MIKQKKAEKEKKRKEEKEKKLAKHMTPSMKEAAA